MNSKTRVIHRPREADAQTAVGCQTGAPGRSSCFGQLILNKDLIKGKKRKRPIELFGSLPRWCGGKESVNSGDTEITYSVLGLGRSPGVENGNLLQYFCLENSMTRAAWWAAVHGVTKSQT